MRILLIDDSKAIHAFVSACFEGTGVTLDHAYNGEEGVSTVEASKGAYDLVLLDWEMPILEGPQTFDRIRKLGYQCPVIMMTSRNSVPDITRMLAAGVNEYVLKPYTQDILFEKISQVLGRSLYATSP